MTFYHEDPSELLPELDQNDESSDVLFQQFKAMQNAESEPARLVLVFNNSDDRTEFFRAIMKIKPQDMEGAERPPFALVKNWRTSGGEDVPL